MHTRSALQLRVFILPHPTMRARARALAAWCRYPQAGQLQGQLAQRQAELAQQREELQALRTSEDELKEALAQSREAAEQVRGGARRHAWPPAWPYHVVRRGRGGGGGGSGRGRAGNGRDGTGALSVWGLGGLCLGGLMRAGLAKLGRAAHALLVLPSCLLITCVVMYLGDHEHEHRPCNWLAFCVCPQCVLLALGARPPAGGCAAGWARRGAGAAG